MGGRNMAIFKQKVEKNYVMISKSLLWNRDLSLPDIGMLSLIFQLPDNWKFSIRGLAKILNSGEYAISASLKRLEKKGYIKRKTIHGKNGCFETSIEAFFEKQNGEIPNFSLEEMEKIMREELALEDPIYSVSNSEMDVEEGQMTITDWLNSMDEEDETEETEDNTDTPNEDFISLDKTKSEQVLDKNPKEISHNVFTLIQDENDYIDITKNNNFFINTIANIFATNKKNRTSNTIAPYLIFKNKIKRSASKITNNNKTNNYVTLKDLESCRETVRNNINYSAFIEENVDLHQIDEYIEIMIEAICSKKKTLRINRENISQEVVKNRLLSLQHEDIQYVLTCINSNATNIKNIKSYLLTTLYNAKLTNGNYVKTKNSWKKPKNPFDYENQRDDIDFEKLEKELIARKKFNSDN